MLIRRAAAVVLVLALTTPGMAHSAPLRIATWSPDLKRQGPGLLYRDIRSGKDKQIAAGVQVIAAVSPDILLLTGMDWDYDNLALTAYADLLAAAGVDYPYRHASRPNSGMATGLDLDGNGRTGTPADAQGFGRFAGEGGMALLSRHPIETAVDFSDSLWRDLPDHTMPPTPPAIAAIQRLSSVAHWDIRVMIDDTPLHLLAYAASPPAFDGLDKRNIRRNHDESLFWLHHLPDAPFVVIGDANLDSHDGDGDPQAIAALLTVTQDPQPRSEGGRLAPRTGINASHQGDPALDTAVWPAENGPGSLRVDYVLPAQGLEVRDAGVFWPAPDAAMADVVRLASRHRLVWVDLDWP